jgi:hypothetical protein
MLQHTIASRLAEIAFASMADFIDVAPDGTLKLTSTASAVRHSTSPT